MVKKGKDVGLLVPTIVIFKEDGSIDEKASRDHIDFLFDNGIPGLLCGGTCTEFSSMTMDERMQVHEMVIDQVNGRGPVYIGVACPGTDESIKLAKHAEKVGATGVFAVGPYYMKPTEEEIIQYYKDIAASVNIPFVIYNNPGLSGVGLSVQDIADLINSGVSNMVKECYGDPTRIQDIKSKLTVDATVIYGEDYGALQGLLVGGNGWTAGCANFIPKECMKIWNLLKVEKDYEAAVDYWYEILPAINMTSQKVMYGRPDERPDFIQIYKTALNLMGRNGGKCRKPLLPLPKEDVDYLKTILKDLGYNV